jgi:hypothetical protein
VIPAARLSIIVIGTGQSKVSPSAPTSQVAFPNIHKTISCL